MFSMFLSSGTPFKVNRLSHGHTLNSAVWLLWVVTLEGQGGNFPSILWILNIIMAFTFFFVLFLYVLNVLFKYNTYPEKLISVMLDEFSQVEHTMLGAPRPRNRT